jgi:hypothetical protein
LFEFGFDFAEILVIFDILPAVYTYSGQLDLAAAKFSAVSNLAAAFCMREINHRSICGGKSRQ